MREVVATGKNDPIGYFQELEKLQIHVLTLIDKVKVKRTVIEALKHHQVYRISTVLRRKAVIKEKLKLLKNVKTKNEAALI